MFLRLGCTFYSYFGFSGYVIPASQRYLENVGLMACVLSQGRIHLPSLHMLHPSHVVTGLACDPGIEVGMLSRFLSTPAPI